MRLTVLWTADAEKSLATFWIEANNRAAITAAAREIDRQLGLQADEIGESRPSGSRILLEAPLGVLNRVDLVDAIVHVYNVWQFDDHRK